MLFFSFKSSDSPFRYVTFQVLKSHKQLVVTIMGSTGQEAERFCSLTALDIKSGSIIY